MDPASAAIGAAGGLLGSLLSHNSASQNRKFTAEQNRLQREFNAAEAQKSRDFQLDMFNRTNAYNTPKATVDRLVAAGLNPALAFGGFEGASFGGSAAQASSSAAGSSAMPDYSGITSAGQAIMQSRLIDAEIDLKESEAVKNYKDVSWIDRLNQADLDLKKLGLDLGIKDLNLKDIEASKLHSEVEKIVADAQFIRDNSFKIIQETSLLEKENVYFKLIKDTQVKESLARVQSLFASAHLSETQAYRLSSLVGSEIALNYANAARSNSEAESIDFKNLINKESLKRFGLSSLSDQQFESIQSVIRNLDSSSSKINKETEFVGMHTLLSSFKSLVDSLRSSLGM